MSAVIAAALQIILLRPLDDKQSCGAGREQLRWRWHMRHILTVFKQIWCSSLKKKRIITRSITYDEIQQLHYRLDFQFFCQFFPHSLMHVRAFNCIWAWIKQRPFEWWWEKSLMHVRIYDVIQKGQVKFKQYRALFISAKVLSYFYKYIMCQRGPLMYIGLK